MDTITIIIITAVLAFITGIFFHYIWSTYMWPNRHQIYAWGFLLRKNDCLGYVCKTDLELHRKGYSLGYSYNKKTALWVAYALSKASIDINNGKDKDRRFQADIDIPEQFRTSLSDYTNSGYDKGHLAPSSAIDFSRKSNTETYLLTNIVLQHAKLNRQAWRSLEHSVKKWTKTKGKLFVVTGPIFKRSIKRYNDIAIPTGFYKVIYCRRRKKCIAFVFPNSPVKSSQLWNYAMSVRKAEIQTGYSFMKKVGWRKRWMKKKLDVNWWKY